MPGSKLPRNLELRINQIANDRAHSTNSRSGYREAYWKEKSRLCAQVVIWLAKGESIEDVMERLSDRPGEVRAKLLKAIAELKKEIMGRP